MFNITPRKRLWNICYKILLITPCTVILAGCYIESEKEKSMKIENDRLEQQLTEMEESMDLIESFYKEYEDFELYFTKAEEHINHKAWKNAEFSIRKAITIYPENFDAQYTFAKILGYQCKETHTGCNRVEEQFKLLLERYPNQTAKIKWLQRAVK